MPANKAADPKRQRIGKQNREEGKAFEERIDKAFAYMRARGSALVDKTPEPTKVIKRLEKGQFIAVFSTKAQPDYKGTKKGGRTVMYEAKFTSSDRITADRVTEAQAEYLTQAETLGARCYVLAGFLSGKVYQIPWQEWRLMDKYFGRKHVKESDLHDYQVPLGTFGQLLIK